MKSPKSVSYFPLFINFKLIDLLLISLLCFVLILFGNAGQNDTTCDQFYRLWNSVECRVFFFFFCFFQYVAYSLPQVKYTR